MKTDYEKDAEAVEAIERIVREPLPTFRESMQRLDRQARKPYKIWVTREQWEDIILSRT
jgi:hypothetical protein